MPTLSEMLIASGLESSQKAPDISGAITQGAQLAQTIEGMKQGRAQLELQKQNLQMQKANSVVDTMKIAASSKDKRLKDFLLKKVLPAKVNALGMGEFFTPETLEMVQSSEDAQKKVLGLQLYLDEEVRAGRMRGDEAYAYAQQKLNDPEELAMLDTDQLFDAQKFKHSEEGKSTRKIMEVQAAMGKQVQAQQAAPVVAEATEKAKGRVKYLAEEKAAGEAGIDSLLDVADKLDNPSTSKVNTGKLTQAIPGLRSDAVQSLLSPETVAAKTQAQSALNALLRQTLGAQFTQQEGERVLNQIWDDKQPNKENSRRVRLKAKQIQAEMKAKAETLGVGGSPADIKKKEFLKLSPESQKKALPGFAKYLNMSIEEAKKELGLK